MDDHKIVRQGVRAFLQTLADITVVAKADSGTEAVISAGKDRPQSDSDQDLEIPG